MTTIAESVNLQSPNCLFKANPDVRSWIAGISCRPRIPPYRSPRKPRGTCLRGFGVQLHCHDGTSGRRFRSDSGGGQGGGPRTVAPPSGIGESPGPGDMPHGPSPPSSKRGTVKNTGGAVREAGRAAQGATRALNENVPQETRDSLCRECLPRSKAACPLTGNSPPRESPGARARKAFPNLFGPTAHLFEPASHPFEPAEHLFEPTVPLSGTRRSAARASHAVSPHRPFAHGSPTRQESPR